MVVSSTAYCLRAVNRRRFGLLARVRRWVRDLDWVRVIGGGLRL